MIEPLSLLSPRALAALFALLVSRCQRGRELRDLSLSSCVRVFVWRVCLACLSRNLFSRVEPCLLWFGYARETYLSYGVRHMHSIASY